MKPVKIRIFLAPWMLTAAWLVASTSVAAEPDVKLPNRSATMSLVQREITSGLKWRGNQEVFNRFRAYAAHQLDSTAGDKPTGTELTGNCRLAWFEHLLRDPIAAAAEAEKFTRQLHEAAAGDHRGLEKALAMAAEKLGLKTIEPRKFDEVGSPDAALDAVKSALAEAEKGYLAAMAPLKPEQVQELSNSLYSVTTAQVQMGHTFGYGGYGHRLCNLLELIDRNGLHAAAGALVPLTDPKFLEQLAAIPDEGSVKVAGVTGTVVKQIETPQGDIIIGGKGRNEYRLDEMGKVAAVIDLGGNDVYYEGTVSANRPLLVVIDLAGNDLYRGTRPGIQGSSILGVSMLLDVKGDDGYDARDVAQGSTVGGVGILIDCAGDDWYRGLRRVQGQAICGFGFLINREGNDRYRAALLAQGLGGPLGFGLLEDTSGKDYYYAGGLYLDSYPETPGYDAFAQGVGCGARGEANGGIGVILEGGGDDVYEYDYFAGGGGYWFGTGFARDFGGNDRHIGGTRTAYDGGSRGEPLFQRFNNGFGCHYGVGFAFDDEGNDTYGGTIMGQGFAWDIAVGGLFDFAGNDRYDSTGAGNEGSSGQGAIGILVDLAGDDVYIGRSQGSAPAGISYHSPSECGGNFAFLLDYGGKDQYGNGAKDNTYNAISTGTGFLIDRPAPGTEVPLGFNSAVSVRPYAAPKEDSPRSGRRGLFSRD
ncbi:MAG: hypothetical protein ACYC35_05420 [Pirellulales bacterium]